MPSSEPRWSVPSRQQQGRDTERALLRKRGMQQHPMSGAGSIKYDGSDRETIAEVKDANQSFTLKGKELGESYRHAVREGKEAVWLIKFADGLLPRGHVAEVRIVPEDG